MKINLRVFSYYSRAFLFLLVTFGHIIAQQDRTIIVGCAEFLDETGEIKIGKNAVGEFNDDLVRHLETSRTLRFRVEEPSTAFLKLLPKTRDLAKKQLPNLSTELSKLKRQNQFYLIATISNLDHIVIANAVLYASEITVKGESSRVENIKVRLLQRIHVEGTFDTASTIRRRLTDYLAADLVSQIEAKLDSSLRVLITPFQSYGRDPDFDKLGGMIAAILRNRLSVSPRIRVIMSDSTYWPTANNGSAFRFRGWTLPELGLREGAKYVISGSYFEQKGTISIEASHVDVETGHSILSKSIFVDSLNGRRLYDALGELGDDMRNAIELNDAIKKKVPPTWISVAALPPFPPTRENKNLSLEIVSIITRRLKSLVSRHPTMNVEVSSSSRVTEEFVGHETEPVVIARALNTQHLWMIKLERPQNTFRISLQAINAQTGVRGPLIPFSCTPESVNDAIDSLTSEIKANLLRSIPGSLDNKESTPFLLDSSDLEIRIPERPKTVTVLAAPPYPPFTGNRTVSVGLASSLAKRLSLNKTLRVYPLDDELERYVNCERCFSLDSLQRNIQSQFAWVLRLDDFGNTRRLHSTLYHLANPFGPVITDDADITHIECLDDTFHSLTTRTLRQWAPEVAASDSVQEQKAQIIFFQPFRHALRVRGLVMGFTRGSGSVYLGNDHQVGIEGAIIFLDAPRQYELSFLYNFGKRDTIDGVRYEVIGRYFSGLVRWNRPIHFGFKDWICYYGAGIMMLNAEVRFSHVLGSVVLAGQVIAGVEIPLSYSFFLDVGSTYVYPITRLGGLDGNLNRTFELLKYWSFGAGVGYRF